MTFSSLTNKDKKELRDVIDEMTALSVDSFEKVEMAIAYGCPRGQFISIANAKTENKGQPFGPQLKQLKKTVEDALGEGSFDEEEIVSLLDSIVRNNRELIHFRNLANGFNVRAFVINKIVEIRTRSPHDSGRALFNDLFQIEGIEAPPSSELAEDVDNISETTAVTELSEPSRPYFNEETKKMVIDVVLGVGLGVGAIALLV